MFCIKCGQQIADDMKFCPSCGAETIVSSNLNDAIVSNNSDNNYIDPNGSNNNYVDPNGFNNNYIAPDNFNNNYISTDAPDNGNNNYILANAPNNSNNVNNEASNTNPHPVMPENKSPAAQSNILGFLGILLGLVLPPIGLILGVIGIILARKNRKDNDTASINNYNDNIVAIITSVASLNVWILIFLMIILGCM